MKESEVLWDKELEREIGQKQSPDFLTPCIHPSIPGLQLLDILTRLR